MNSEFAVPSREVSDRVASFIQNAIDLTLWPERRAVLVSDCVMTWLHDSPLWSDGFQNALSEKFPAGMYIVGFDWASDGTKATAQIRVQGTPTNLTDVFWERSSRIDGFLTNSQMIIVCGEPFSTLVVVDVFRDLLAVLDLPGGRTPEALMKEFGTPTSPPDSH